MQIWSEQGVAWEQQAGTSRGWLGLSWWSRGRSAEELLQGRWAKLARKLDRDCELLRRRMERAL